MWRQNGRSFTWGDAKYQYSPTYATCTCSGLRQAGDWATWRPITWI